MSLIPTIYASDDPGAPSLTGTAGSFVALLDAILVDGYGTGPTAKAGLGWTREFTAANKRAYRGNMATASGCYLRVDDTNARYAWMQAYSAMSDIDTGTDVAPATADRPNGMLWPKSATTDATSRWWWAIGNERCLYLWIVPAAFPSGTTNHAGGAPYFFGDLVSIRPNNPYAFAISLTGITDYTGSNSTTISYLFGTRTGSAGQPTIANSVATMVRGIGGGSGSVYLQQGSIVIGTGLSIGNGNVPYPIYDGGPFVCERARLWQSGTIPSARWPGVFAHYHGRPFADLSEVAGLLNKNFHTESGTVTNGRGQIFFEVGEEWV